MRDLDKALADIGEIRSRMAAGETFRGLGPAALAATGALALAAAALQALWLGDAATRPLDFLGLWAATAAIAVVLIGMEMRRRAHRHHAGLADAMIHRAVEQFLPAAAAGIALPLVLAATAPNTLWLVPGLWQVLVGLGAFAAARTLPRRTSVVAAWYFVAGIATIMMASDGHALSPWAMGLPFAIGQMLMAFVLACDPGRGHGEDHA
jgi:hypothetical protein